MALKDWKIEWNKTDSEKEVWRDKAIILRQTFVP